jgi:hypothetical protein
VQYAAGRGYCFSKRLCAFDWLCACQGLMSVEWSTRGRSTSAPTVTGDRGIGRPWNVFAPAHPIGCVFLSQAGVRTCLTHVELIDSLSKEVAPCGQNKHSCQE